MENKDNRNLEEEMDTASEAKAGEETAEAPRTEETADADTDSSEGNGAVSYTHLDVYKRQSGNCGPLLEAGRSFGLFLLPRRI